MLSIFPNLSIYYTPFSLKVPIDGKFGQWSEYSKCSQSCGGGFQNRTRKCDSPAPANGGTDCVGNRTETRECFIKPCPVNGAFGKWSNYSTCSVSCGGGVQFRERYCDSPSPKYGGKNCDGLRRESRFCEETECPGKLIDAIFDFCLLMRMISNKYMSTLQMSSIYFTLPPLSININVFLDADIGSKITKKVKYKLVSKYLAGTFLN